ncbi:hypothetical protein J6590_045628 [Homalodisca vitripennis]|nr:hypothetical protein J6590_045628 [Homalodisca vitripennis]
MSAATLGNTVNMTVSAQPSIKMHTVYNRCQHTTDMQVPLYAVEGRPPTKGPTYSHAMISLRGHVHLKRSKVGNEEAHTYLYIVSTSETPIDR